MPTLHHSPDEIAWEIPIRSRYYAGSVSTHIYCAVALVAILVIVRFLVKRGGVLRDPTTGSPLSEAKYGQGTFTARSIERKEGQWAGAFTESKCEREASKTERVWGPGALKASPSQLGPLPSSTTMDEGESGQREDHYPWSALAVSRAVSTNTPKQRPHTPSTTDQSFVTLTALTNSGRLQPTSSSRKSSTERLTGSSDGIAGRASRDKTVVSMDGSSSHTLNDLDRVELDGDSGATSLDFRDERFHPVRNSPSSDLGFTIPRHFTRPPPPPPLTPPTLHGNSFPFEDRQPNDAASLPPSLDASFIHQPNPEYAGDASPTDVLRSSLQSATTLPQRRSYTKSVPIGIPVSSALAGTTDSASSSTETMTPGSAAGTFSPSSFPPSSPFLPPPPPSAPPEYKFVGGPGGPGVFLSQQEINLQGEIISVVDDAGHGWKRHTRVYGGGVCLACIAAAARNGGQGGFYGDTVPLEDRRY